MEQDCLKETRCANFRQNYPTYTRSCEAYRKEKEILEMKHKRNVSFLEARNIVSTYMGENPNPLLHGGWIQSIKITDTELSWRN